MCEIELCPYCGYVNQALCDRLHHNYLFSIYVINKQTTVHW
jgi:hypothetical protein